MMAFTGRLKLGAVIIAHGDPGVTGFGGVGPVVRQVVSTGGVAAAGNKTVTESESELKTSNWVPVALATTVWALLTAMVVKELVEKFRTSMAPRSANPFTVALGTAANPVWLEVGSVMLDVGPGSLTPVPIEASSVVSTAKTVF